MMSSLFLRACRREAVEHTPIWMMRQAGRSLPEYRAVRARHAFMDICREPELCAEVTLQPVRRLGVDAAILFADIMTPLLAVGVELDLVEHLGPVINQPIRDQHDLAQLRPLEPEQDISHVIASVRAIKRELAATTALIGFAGAPFTLASYLVEGKGSRTFTKTKALMYRAPDLWRSLMERLSAITATYLRAQIDSGADAVQIFDSWVGCLSPADYATYVQPYNRRIIRTLREWDVPVIYFGTNTTTLLPLMRKDGASVIGVDWHIPLDNAWKAIGAKTAIQGNLDPAVLLGPWEVVEQQARDILQRAGGRPGHIFNLGHGILPETPLDNLIRLVEFVQTYQAEDRGGTRKSRNSSRKDTEMRHLASRVSP
jgi:uroporphyrinogen decarboxylase